MVERIGHHESQAIPPFVQRHGLITVGEAPRQKGRCRTLEAHGWIQQHLQAQLFTDQFEQGLLFQHIIREEDFREGLAARLVLGQRVRHRLLGDNAGPVHELGNGSIVVLIHGGDGDSAKRLFFRYAESNSRNVERRLFLSALRS
jgi:hypothetical protein